MSFSIVGELEKTVLIIQTMLSFKTAKEHFPFLNNIRPIGRYLISIAQHQHSLVNPFKNKMKINKSLGVGPFAPNNSVNSEGRKAIKIARQFVFYVLIIQFITYFRLMLGIPRKSGNPQIGGRE